ncbi:MAG: Smr/MutS family protein, partial [Vicingus serpentipes]|nr:Smr/MutS family protein [Vicingus serpentipes]
IRCTDGFDYKVSSNEVLLVGDDNKYNYILDNEELIKKISPQLNTKKKGYQPTGVLSRYLQSAKYSCEATLEIDLHLEELVEFPQKLEDWQKLHTQMQHVKKCLNAALDKKIQKIVFIHGVGTGVLKMEIRNYLADFSNLIVKDADFREYGMGATEVIVKY